MAQPLPPSLAEARRKWRGQYAEEAIKIINDLMTHSQDEWLRFAAANERMERCWGKTQTHVLDEDVEFQPSTRQSTKCTSA
jgi:hypothetical protein